MMDDFNARRVTPMMRLAVARAPSKAEPKGFVDSPSTTPSNRQLHGHLNNAKKAASDPEKRMHVFKALTALNRRAKAATPPPPSDMGMTGLT